MSDTDSKAPPPERDDIAPSRAIADLLDAIGQLETTTYHLKIYRKDLGTWGYLANLGEIDDPAGLEDMIRQQYGAGDYQLRLTDSAHKHVRSRVIRILARPGDPEPRSTAPAPGSAADRIDRLEALVTQLADRLSAPPAAAASDAMQMALQMAQTMVTAQTAAITPLVERLRDAQQSDGQTQLDAFLRGLKLAREMETPAPASGIEGALARLAEPIASYLQRSAPGAAPTPAADPMSVSPVVADLSPHLSQLVDAARARMDPETVARLVVRHAGGDTRALQELVQMHTAADEIVQVQPALAQRRAWLDSVLDAIAELVLEGDAAPAGDGYRHPALDAFPDLDD